jgi:hypothetical protein
MNGLKKFILSRKTGVILIIGILVLFVLVLLLYKTTGHNFSIRAMFSPVKDITMAILDNKSVVSSQQGNYTDIILLHHSVGQNLIEQGNVRQGFLTEGYNFWDHGYNSPGLTDPYGNPKGYSYIVPNDNTDIDGLANVFNQKVYPLPLNTLSSLLQHEVIIFKSCYPNNNISSEDQLAQNKLHYLAIRDVIDKYPNKLFILITTPPLNPAETNKEAAIRARTLSTWLSSEDFIKGKHNLAVFDFYSFLADNNSQSDNFNMLRKEYQNGSDSHPNSLANEIIGSEFVKFVITSVQNYRSN